MTLEAFYDNISTLRDRFQNRDLETYLLALTGIVQHKREQPLHALLLIQYLEEAFTAEPVPLQQKWLAITQAPDEHIMSKKFTNPELSPIDKTTASETAGFVYTEAVLQFQIAELHKMRNKQLNDDMRYFGIDSETGNRWYNFDPFTNLECGVRCIIDNEEEEDENKTMTVTWQTLGELLEMGRIYE